MIVSAKRLLPFYSERHVIKKSTLIAAVMLSFLCGVAFYAMGEHIAHSSVEKAHVTGIGGVFFKCSKPKEVREWYSKNLGLNVNQYGAVFEWYQGADSSKKGFSQWSPFKASTTYFEPSQKDFMINYRVDNLDALVADLRTSGVQIVDTVQSVSYGKFVHIMDPDGNKLELWEPNDVEYERLGITMGSRTTK